VTDDARNHPENKLAEPRTKINPSELDDAERRGDGTVCQAPNLVGKISSKTFRKRGGVVGERKPNKTSSAIFRGTVANWAKALCHVIQSSSAAGPVGRYGMPGAVVHSPTRRASRLLGDDRANLFYMGGTNLKTKSSRIAKEEGVAAGKLTALEGLLQKRKDNLPSHSTGKIRQAGRIGKRRNTHVPGKPDWMIFLTTTPIDPIDEELMEPPASS